jgi:hypothetical protein
MPKETPPKLAEFARRLLAHDSASSKASSPKVFTTFRIFAKLREPLVELAGVGGFRSLLSRSIALASLEVQWLSAVHIRADGSLEGVPELAAKISAEELALGEVALAVHLVELLVTFIGPTLTLQLLQHVWPQMDELNL